MCVESRKCVFVCVLCRHKKNEVFLDVVESVNLLVNSNGTLVVSEVRQGAPGGQGRAQQCGQHQGVGEVGRGGCSNAVRRAASNKEGTQSN